MTNYARGRRSEYRTMRLLEGAGYRCVRSAGSHTEVDVIGIGATDFVLVQVKLNCRASAEEIEGLKLLRTPKNCKKLIHEWKSRARVPMVRQV